MLHKVIGRRTANLRTQIKRPKEIVEIGRLTRQVGKAILEVLLIAGEGILDGLFDSIYHPHMNFAKYSGQYRYRSVYKSAKRLEKRGLVEINNKDGKLHCKLTEKGYQYAEALELLKLKIEPQKKWDGRFRFIIFDIPETHKIVREVLREKIKSLGLVQIQKSVFLTPWPCKSVIEKIQAVYQADRYIRYLEVTSFDGEEFFKKRFKI